MLIDWEHPFSFQRHIAIIKPNRTLLDGKFLCHFLKSVLGKKQAEIYAEGLAQKTITLRSLGQFCVPTPPIHIQKTICAELDKIDQLLSKSQKALDSCRCLSAKVRNELMTGTAHV